MAKKVSQMMVNTGVTSVWVSNTMKLINRMIGIAVVGSTTVGVPPIRKDIVPVAPVVMVVTNVTIHPQGTTK